MQAAFGKQSKPYSVELLCRHHDISKFDCGHEILNSELKRIGSSDYDPDEGVAIVASSDDGSVMGFVVVTDILLDLGHGSEERCYFLASLAVDEKHVGSDMAGDLISRAYRIRKARKKRNKVYAATLVNTVYDQNLEKRVQGLKFKRLPGNPFLWFRRGSS